MSDDHTQLEVTKRKVLGSLTAVGATSVAAGAGTFAYFSDTETSSNNTISAGTVDFDGSVSGSAEINSKPGDSNKGSRSATDEISATYGGSVEPVEVDLSITLRDPSSPTEVSEPSDTDLDNELDARSFAKAVQVDVAKFHNDNGSGEAASASTETLVDLESTDNLTANKSDPGAEGLDLRELNDHLNNTTNEFGSVYQDDTVSLELGITIDPEATNEYQADSVEFVVTFEARQSTS